MRAALLVLAASLAACSRKPAAPAAPNAAALAVELATYKQVLVPLMPVTAENFARAAKFKGGAANVGPGDFQEVYAYGESLVSGSTVAVLLAYSGAWLLPQGAAARPMTPPQFLRAFMNDEAAARAVLITPKGGLIVAREQTLDVLIEARKAGAKTADLPFAVIRASK